MWMVELESADVFRFGPPVMLYDAPGWTGSASFGEPYEVEQGNERFLIATAAEVEGPTGPRYILVNNFSEELKRLVPE